MKTSHLVLVSIATAATAAAAGGVLRRRLASFASEGEELRETAKTLQQRNNQLAALYNVFCQVTETLSLQHVVDATMRESLRLMNAHGVVLWLLKDEMLVPQGGLTNSGRPLRLEPQRLDETITGWVASVGRTQRIDDSNQELLLERQTAMGVRSGICVPLIVGARVVGVLNVWSAERNRFDDEDQRVLEMMASQVATAVAAAEAMDDSELKAYHDPLTGLPNRYQLNEDLAGILPDLVLAGRDAVVAMIDIDQFKTINDAFGHQAGDITLQKLAGVLRNSIREQDRLYRYGGEEFVLIFVDADPAEAVQLADRMRRTVAATPLTAERSATASPVTISVGLAALGDLAENFISLIELADAAMYEAKQSGRNRIVFRQGAPNTELAA